VNYSLQIKESAFKELQRIDKPQRLRIIKAIEALPQITRDTPEWR
jgi:mRNA-degrading endonuclease RelE of RelBE toxin-antitoxin system